MRRVAPSAFGDEGSTPEVEARIALAVHPLDGLNPPGEPFAWGARQRAQRCAEQLRAASSGHQANTIALAAIRDYLTLAERFGESFYIKRFTAALEAAPVTNGAAGDEPPRGWARRVLSTVAHPTRWFVLG